MPGVDVGSLSLRLTVPRSLRPRAEALRRGAEEELIPVALRAMERRLSQHFGEHAVIRIRSLDLRLRMAASDLATPERAEALGEDIAEQVRSMAAIETASVRPRQADAPVRVWPNACQFAAVRLAAAARRETGPEGRKEEFGAVWLALLRVPPAELVAILAEAAKAGELRTVLARLSAREVSALFRTLPPATPPQVRRAIERRLAKDRSARPPVSSSPAPSEVQKLGREQGSADGVVGSRNAGQAGPLPEPEGGPFKSRRKAGPRPLLADSAAIGRDEKTTPPRAATSEVLGHRDVPPPRDKATRAIRAQASAAVGAEEFVPNPATADESEIIPDLAGETSFHSEWCGLGYLIPIATKAELPEALWQIGLDEGAVLAHAFARIAHGSADPATRMPCRRFPKAPPRIGRCPDWAREELVCGALARGEMLGAERAMLSSRIDDLTACFAPGGAFAVDAWLAAFLLALFEAMSGIEIAGGALERSFARVGRIETDDEAIRIVQPIEAIDIDIRRAGLDTDPGWLPWLEKRMVFIFEGGEDEQ